jgi:hypothetical protein
LEGNSLRDHDKFMRFKSHYGNIAAKILLASATCQITFVGRIRWETGGGISGYGSP